jgi:hypothetical protein
MEFNYRKDDNHRLFKSLEENSSFGIEKPQNYIPLYNCYFSLNQTNYKHIGLNNPLSLDALTSQETNNIFDCIIKSDSSKESEKKKTYLKFSPLLDPIKYLLGKYDIEDKNLFNLPSLNSLTDPSSCNPKVNHYNNTAYIDSFFTYLTSQLYHKHGFVNGLDFYGSFLAIKKDFRINIIDDIDYLNDSVFFRKNDKVLYELEHIEVDGLNTDTRNYRKKIVIEDNNDISGSSGENIKDNNTLVLNLSDICDLNDIDTIVAHDSNCENDIMKDISEYELTPLDIETTINNEHEKTKLQSETSSCSSRTSNTSGSINDNDNVGGSGDNNDNNSNDDDYDSNECDDENDNDNENDDENDSNENDDENDSNENDDENDNDYEDCSDSEGEDDELIAKIKSFPVQVISLEHCENTLDDLMNNGDITDEMWDSIVMQILLSLITFQNAFHLTHNDLHTNNIMYSQTDKKFLYYKINHTYYKVPTYGKIYKIIDFGRGIYKFRGQILCSDSFAKDGDAATQYNCEPYINDKKPRLEPSYSFDLCRLGCALYDYLVDEPKTKITQIMLEWIKDDKGRNILYKKNGDERYPDFKLYKMIARTVSKHIPNNVLQNPYFEKFIVRKKDLKKNTKIIDIDSIPCYV